MARKHSKQTSRKQPVERVLLEPAQYSKERIATEVPAGTKGAIVIKQDDGSEKFFVVSFKVVKPARYAVTALGPTTARGQKNDPKAMAPKGAKVSKSAPTSGGKK